MIFHAQQSDNSVFSQRVDSLGAHLWRKIAQIDECKGQWNAGLRLHPSILGRLKQSVLVTSTGASTRIEGAELSDEEIEKMMRGISMQKMSTRDMQEVQGYYELLSNVFQSWRYLSFSEGMIKHFHQQLLKYVEKDEKHRGEYKRDENKVMMVNRAGDSIGVLFDTTSVALTPLEMGELVDWTRAALQLHEIHPLAVIGNFVVQFLKIHPFRDGNGRMSRILTNFLLLKTGYEFVPYISHEKIVEDNKVDYYLALRESQKTMGSNHDSIEKWMSFFLETILLQAKMAVEMTKKKHLEQLLSPQQQKIWEYIQKNRDFSAGEIEKSLSIPRISVNQVLKKFLELQVIQTVGIGRAVRYQLVE